MKIPVKIYDPKKEKKVIVGEYDDATKTFTKRVGIDHYMKKFQGYGIQESALLELEKKGCITVKIVDEETTHITTLFNWITNGIKKDYGHGSQIFLPITKFGE